VIGPRDIKRGVHLLTNAEMTLLIEDALAEEEPTAKGRRKRRDSATLRGDKLTEEQITQVGPETVTMACCLVECLRCSVLSLCMTERDGCSACLEHAPE